LCTKTVVVSRQQFVQVANLTQCVKRQKLILIVLLQDSADPPVKLNVVCREQRRREELIRITVKLGHVLTTASAPPPVAWLLALQVEYR